MKIKKYRIVNMKRFSMFIFSVSLILIGIIYLFMNYSNAHSFTYEQNYKQVIVKTGDTLWNIAREHMPENYDIRKMVHVIREFNNMETADIYPGDLVKIPIINK